MYVYDSNVMIMIEMKNGSEEEIIKAFIGLTQDLNIRGINT